MGSKTSEKQNTQKEWAAWVPMPPSINKLYFVRWNSMHYTSKAKRYMAECWEALKESSSDVSPGFTREDAIDIRIEISRKRVVTASWPKTAKNKFSRWDSQNYDKLMYDIVCEFLDIDDSQFVHREIDKSEIKEGEEEGIWIWVRSVEGSPWENGGPVKRKARRLMRK